jgi:uncharacterized protein
MEFERKSFDSKAAIEDAEQGIVHAVVSVFGNVDFANEVVVKGAFANALANAKSKGKYPPGVWSHDWSLPVAKTLDMWEEEDGLHVIGKFNMGTQRGRETFSDIKEGIITEYSFGYRVLRDEQKDGSRHLLELDIHEWSPVLVGCNPATYTVGVKDNPHAGMTLDDQVESVLAANSNLINRLSELKELRQKEGRVLSGSRREQAKSLLGQLENLLTIYEPQPNTEAEGKQAKADEILRLIHDAEITLAQITLLR